MYSPPPENEARAESSCARPARYAVPLQPFISKKNRDTWALRAHLRFRV